MPDLIFQSQREHALTVACDYCRAAVGEPCRDPHTGYELVRQAAHHVRLDAPTPSTAEAPA